MAKTKPHIVSDSVQLPLFRPPSLWTPPAVSTLPSWHGARRIGIDVETRDDNLSELGPGVRRGAYVCGISFSIEDGPSHYLPIKHAGGDNLPEEQVWSYLRDQAKNYAGDICGANLSYDLDFLAEQNVVFWQCRFRDVMVAEPLIDEWRDSYSLENISHKYGYAGKNEELLRMAASAWGWNTIREVKKNIWRLPARYVGPYGSDDAKLPLLVLRKQERQIESQDLQGIYDLECQVLPVLLKMRRRGVRIDFKKLDEVEAKTLVEQQVQHDIIRAETGIRVGFDDLDKKGIMAGVCEAAGIKLGRTPPSKGHPDGQIKIDKATLEAVVKTNKVAAAILEAKVCYKIRNTFVASIRKYATKGRIHCTFNQLRSQRENSDDLFGAAPGRISCVPKSNSEILTERGWLRWNQLEVGERVMGYNVTTGEYEWTRLRGVHDNGEATVGLIQTRPGNEFYCTEDHRWVLYSGSSHFTAAGELRLGGRKIVLSPGHAEEVIGWHPTGMADTWCPTTDLGTWVMRQGPRICVTGNCSDPNLQQQPARHPVYGKLWRSIYLPDEGGQWAACDYCFSEDTEILTQNGFVPFPELKQGVPIAQWSAGQVSYAVPTAYQAMPYSGPMYHYYGRVSDLCVSPNHNCLQVTTAGTEFRVKAPEFLKNASRYQIQAGVLPGVEVVDPALLQLVALIQADGSDRKTGYRMWFSKERKIGRCRTILTSLGIPFNEYTCPSRAAGHAFVVQKVPDILRFLGPGKIFNRKAFLVLTPALREVFLDELCQWDGRPNTREYFTTCAANAETVQELACLTGRRTCMSRTITKTGKPFFTVSQSNTDKTQLLRTKGEILSYSGKIYCVTMPQHTVVIRRNGRIMVQGQSQQEPRLLIHYAELSGCPGAKEIADKFRNDTKADMHDETTKLACPDLVPGTPEFKKARKDKCKIIFLGICYSMGEAKMCMSLGYSTELVMIDGKERRVAGAEGKAFLKSFHEKVPFLADMVKKVQRVAWSRGYIITILGRHCRFPKGEKEERKALNRLIQGSAADQTKLSMVECDKAGIPIQLQIHDELGFTIYSPEEAEKAADIMKNCITLRVPSRVDVEIGPSWGGSM